MKKILNLAIPALAVVFLAACNDKDDNIEEITSIAAVKIDSVRFAKDTMQTFSSQTVHTFSNYTQGCEGFYNYNYQSDGFDRYVTAIKAKTNGTCGTDVVGSTHFEFQPQVAGTYIFKFWQGKDAADNNIWLEKTIVVE